MYRTTEQDDKITSKLFYQPTLDYIRTLRRIVDTDPNYLDFHTASVSLKVRELLSLSGGPRAWSRPDVEIVRSVKEAIISLRSFEK